MQPVTQGSALILPMMAHLIRLPELARKFINVIKPNDFSANIESEWQLMWAVCQDFNSQFKTMPSKDNILMEGRQRLAATFSLDLQVQQSLTAMYDQAVEAVFCWDQLVEQQGLDLIKGFLDKRRVIDRYNEAAEKGIITGGHIPMWKELIAISDSFSFESSGEVNPFVSPELAMIGMGPRIGTGLLFLDELMMGGFRHGQLYGFLAPSGGGKTTFANQLILSCARRGLKMLMLTYEQPLDPEYFVPVYAAATRIPREVWEKIPPGGTAKDVLNESQYAEFLKACTEINNNTLYLDMKKGNSGNGGVKEIREKIIYAKKKLGHLDGVIIDWFWPMVTRSYTSSQEAKLRVDNRIYAQSCCEQLKEVCEKENVFGWLAHQAKPDEAKVNKPLDFEDAAELKSFAWFMNGCLCLNKMDENNCAFLKFSKARSSKVDKRTLKLDGEIALFREIGGDMIYDSRQNKMIPKAEQNVIPTGSGGSREEYKGKVNAEGAGSL